MAKMKIETEVSKESYELGQGIVGFVASVKEALSDGWQLGEDLPEVVQSAMQHLVPALNGASELDDEAREDVAAFIKAWTMMGADVYEILKGE